MATVLMKVCWKFKVMFLAALLKYSWETRKLCMFKAHHWMSLCIYPWYYHPNQGSRYMHHLQKFFCVLLFAVCSKNPEHEIYSPSTFLSLQRVLLTVGTTLYNRSLTCFHPITETAHPLNNSNKKGYSWLCQKGLLRRKEILELIFITFLYMLRVVAVKLVNIK